MVFCTVDPERQADEEPEKHKLGSFLGVFELEHEVSDALLQQEKGEIISRCKTFDIHSKAKAQYLKMRQHTGFCLCGRL